MEEVGNAYVALRDKRDKRATAAAAAASLHTAGEKWRCPHGAEHE